MLVFEWNNDNGIWFKFKKKDEKKKKKPNEKWHLNLIERLLKLNWKATMLESIGL